jgi:hypothetical protein
VKRGIYFLPLLSLFLSLSSSAQDTPVAADQPMMPKRRLPIVSVNVGAPLKVSASLGVAYSSREFVYGRHGVSGSGLVAALEPGLGGVKASGGYMVAAETIGYGLQAVLIRTWDSPWHAEPNNTYADAEGAARFWPVPRGSRLVSPLCRERRPMDCSRNNWHRAALRTAGRTLRIPGGSGIEGHTSVRLSYAPSPTVRRVLMCGISNPR